MVALKLYIDAQPSGKLHEAPFASQIRSQSEGPESYIEAPPARQEPTYEPSSETHGSRD